MTNLPPDFGDDDPTVVRARPAPRRRPGAGPPGGPTLDDPLAAPTVMTGPRQSGAPAVKPLEALPIAELGIRNALVGAATPLLSLIFQLRATMRHNDVSGLHNGVIEQVKNFEEAALRAGVSPEDVTAARYVLCSAIDETVLSTPWGSQSVWSTSTLLNIFYKETWGGEKVFVILERIKGNPERYAALIELIDLVLALGFMGRYRVIDNGPFQLEEIRNELWRILRARRDDRPQELSPRWKGEKRGQTLRDYLPLWVVFAVGGAVLVGVYAIFEWTLNERVQPTIEHVDRIAR